MNNKIKDLSNKRFGMVKVLNLAYIKDGRTYWNCICDCGEKFVRRNDIIQRNDVKSCGCYRIKNNKFCGLKHGDTKRDNINPLYHIWQGMKDRCYNENNVNSVHWRGRGIIVCDEWLNNYISFKKWSIENGYKKGLTIDRIDVNGNYEPSNCRWITRAEQNKNTTRTKHILYNGINYTIPDFAKIFHVHPETVRYWLYKKNISIEIFIKRMGGDTNETSITKL